MTALHVQLSNFRVTYSARRDAPLVHIVLRSAQTHIKPIKSPPGVHAADRSCVCFPSWKEKWQEAAPDGASLLHLSLRAVDLRSKWRRRLSRATSQRVSPALGSVSLGLATLATGTVRRSVRVPADVRDGSYFDVSFDAVVEEKRDIRLRLDYVEVRCPRPLRSAYLVVAVDGRCVLAPEKFVHVASPTFDDLPPVVLPRYSLAKLARATVTIRVHEAEGGNRCVGELCLPMHDLWGAVVCATRPAPFQGELRPRTNDYQTDDTETTTNSQPSQPAAESLGSLRGMFLLDNVPRTGQMVGGITTHTGMTGGRPIYAGAVLPAGEIVRSEGADEHLQLPRHWVQLYDTFGYQFFHNTATCANSWLRPGDIDGDAALAALGFERTDNGLYRARASGAVTWVHPAAERIGSINYTSASEDTHSEMESGWYGLTPGSTPGRSIMPSRTVSSFSLPRAPSVPFPEELTLSEAAGSPEAISGAHGSAPDVDRDEQQHSNTPDEPVLGVDIEQSAEEERRRRESRDEFIIEMKWLRLRDRGDYQIIPGPATEGHSLTAVHGGSTLLKFGGKGKSDKVNDVYAYDSHSMNWSTLHTLGAPPVARFGHGAVALGADKSRLLIFGGSCREGRLNDLHMLHVDNLAWSPVHASGTPPEARSRLGMCATNSGDVALVFGGRSIYRFLGGTYFDSEHVHAFHAARAQWIQLTPRGPGERPAPRSGAAVQFINGRCMFVHGGYDDGDQYYSDSFLFDLASCSWQRTPYPDEPTAPKACESHASTVVGDDVLVYGGEMERGGYSSKLAMFDTGLLRWTHRPPAISGYAPPGLCGAAMATANNSTVLLTGGDSGFSMSREAFALDIARYPLAEVEALRARARERLLEHEVCAVCLDARVDTLFLWCGHSVCCRRCAKKMRRGCPVCRRPFSTILYDI